MSKNTLIVNLYAGPCAGKSTAAAYIFSKLKMQGVEVELVTEYAKEKCWEHNGEAFKCQLYVNAKQAYYISRVHGKVDVIITDSPLLLGAVYGTEEYVKQAAYGEDRKYTNRLDYVLKRNEKYKYNQNGRNENEDDAKRIDEKIIEILKQENVAYKSLLSTELNYDRMIDEILKKIKGDE